LLHSFLVSLLLLGIFPPKVEHSLQSLLALVTLEAFGALLDSGSIYKALASACAEAIYHPSFSSFYEEPSFLLRNTCPVRRKNKISKFRFPS
jgi:hypothetical protein